ncbi:hypothetical protein BC834DRAFT_324666 [Gloeopeniophorella convolvens]|nr:hypothetical protein BC834DRAFT_324666 [Gloeopeniophorella convolvens]
MEPAANPPAPLHERPEPEPAERIELEVLSASDPVPSPIVVGPHTHAADPEDPEANDTGTPPPWGIKLTGYRLLNIIVLIAVGLAKFILSLKGQSATPTGLEWMAGSILAAILYWLGLYEAVEPPRWIWFLHTDYAPAISYSCKCFLGGVMQALALYWEMLPFCLFIGIPVLVLMRVPSHPVASFSRDISTTLLSWSLCGILIFMLPEVGTLMPSRTRV